MTAMYPTTPGISFRGAMSGWFHLGAVEPEDGRAQGEAARTRLSLAVAVTIRDVRAFMRDRDRAGDLQASIDFLPLGREIRSARGAFNLLAPTPDNDCRVTTIECTFEADGTRYYLAGRTETPVEPSRDAWGESTAIPVRLHEGADAQAPIVGAGVLILTADDLARLVSSMRVTGAESLGDTTLTLTGFGRFFLGDLWDAYAHPPGGLRRRWNALARGARRLVGG